MAIVDETNAAEFLRRMEPFLVTAEALRDARDLDGDAAVPALLVDFDHRHIVISGVVASPAFEGFVPPGWVPRAGEFLEGVPPSLRFWG
jgi:hypothetical protein